jgi:hypothetical protein
LNQRERLRKAEFLGNPNLFDGVNNERGWKERTMDVKFFPLTLEIDGKRIVVAHPWPMNLDNSLYGLYESMAFSWAVMFFEKILVITPITYN